VTAPIDPPEGPDLPPGPPTSEYVLLCTRGPSVSLMFGENLLRAVGAAAERCGYRDVMVDSAGRLWGKPPVVTRGHLSAVPK